MEKIESGNWHLLGNSAGQLAGQLTAQLPLAAARLAASLATKLVAPVSTVDVAIASERLVHAPTAKLALEVGCSASATFLVLTKSTVRSSVTSVYFGNASSFPAKKLIVRAKASARHLVLSSAAVRSAVTFPRGGNTATLETGKLIFGAGWKGSALSLVLTILAV